MEWDTIKKNIIKTLILISLILLSVNFTYAEDPGTFTELQNLINNAYTGEISLEKDYTFNNQTDSAYTRGVQINNSIKINGNNHTISGNKQAGIFSNEIKVASIIFDNITFTDTGNHFRSEAIYTVSPTTITNCNFHDMYCDASSTNVIAVYSTLNLKSSTFINNTNHYYYSGKIIHSAILNMTNCQFYNNTGEVSIIALADGEIHNSIFIDNHGGRFGGVIYAIAAGLQLVRNSTFINNNATNGGVFYGPVNEVSNSTFINNSATNGGVLYYSQDGQIFGSYYWHYNVFENNHATNKGGVIYSNIYFKSSVNAFINNTASEGKDIYLVHSGTDNELEANWWGNNTPFTDTNRIIIANKSYTPATWVVLNATFLDDYLVVNSPTAIVVYLHKLYNRLTGEIDSYSPGIPTRNIEYSDYLSYQDIITGWTSYTFTPPNIGTFNIQLKVDNEVLNVPLTVINGLTDLSIDLTTQNNQLIYNVTNIVEFTLTLKNSGNPAIRVNVSFKLPEGLEYINDTGKGTYDKNSGIWYLKSLTDESTTTLKINARITNYGSFTLNTNVKSANTDSNSLNDNSQLTLTANKIYDLKITVKTEDIPYGVRYIVNVTNEGRTSATGVYVDCPIPSGLTYKNHTVDGQFDTGTGVWTIGNMGEYDEKTLIVDTYLDSESLITQDFTLHLTETDVNPSNNIVTLEINPSTDLVLTYTLSNNAPYVNDIVVYNLSASTLGPCTGINTKVVLSVDSNLEYISDTSGGSFNGNVWTINTLNIGAIETLSITYKVKMNGTLYINASISSTIKERNESNNNVSTRIIGIPSIDLALNITTSDVKYSIGERIFFNFTLSNLGVSTATNIVISFALPNQLGYVNSSEVGEYYRNNRYQSGRYVLFNPLASGESIDFYIQAEVLNYTNNTITINSFAYGSQIDIVTENDEVTLNLTLVPSVDLDVSLTNALVSRNRIVYSINVYNLGDYQASNVELKFNVPDSLKYSSSSPGKGTYNQNTDTWNIGTLESNDGESVSITVVFNILKIGDITLNGSLNSSDKDIDLNNNYFTSTSTVPVLNLPASLNLNSLSPTANTNFQASGTTSAYQGEVRLTIKDSTNSIVATDLVNVTSSGTFLIRFTGLDSGDYTLIADYTDSNGVFADNTTSLTFKVTNPTPIIPPPVNPPVTPNSTDITNISTNLILTVNTMNNTVILTGILMESNNPFANQNIKILVNDTEYNVLTNNNGRFNQTLTLDKGEYQLTVQYDGLNTSTNQYLPTTTVRSLVINTTLNTTNTTEDVNTTNNTNNTNTTLPAASLISLDDVQFTYGASNYLIGKLTDENNNPLIGHHVSLLLTRVSSGASKTYETVVDYKGEFSLQINLAPGQYTAKASYDGLTINNHEYPPAEDKTVQILINREGETGTPTIITTSNQNYVYGNDNKFIGTLKDNNGNPIIGHHISLLLTRVSSGASKTYDTVVDYKGEFSLQINLAPGEYTIQCSYTGVNNYQSTSSKNTISITRG